MHPILLFFITEKRGWRGGGIAQLVEPQTHVVKVPSLNLVAPQRPGTNFYQITFSEAVKVGCTVYTHL